MKALSRLACLTSQLTSWLRRGVLMASGLAGSAGSVAGPVVAGLVVAGSAGSVAGSVVAGLVVAGPVASVSGPLNSSRLISGLAMLTGHSPLASQPALIIRPVRAAFLAIL